MLVDLRLPSARGCRPVCTCVNGDTYSLLCLSIRCISYHWITKFRMIAYTIPVQDCAILCAHCLPPSRACFLPSFFTYLCHRSGRKQSGYSRLVCRHDNGNTHSLVVMPLLLGINTLGTHAQGEQGKQSTAHQRTRANDSLQLSSQLRNDV